MNLTFTGNPLERLTAFLIKKDQKPVIQALTPDASTREYFRIEWKTASAIACVYGESFIPAEHTYLDVTNLMQKSGLPVAEVYDYDGALGIIVQEDFGDLILREVLENSGEERRENLLRGAISLVAGIQAATPLAFALNSVSSRLRFDEEKLSWELNFFKRHYFETLRGEKLAGNEDKTLESEFAALAAELEGHARVLCHRDFHAANLMIDTADRLRIIDHQDARIGGAGYDLVSLLLDRVLSAPDEDWLAERKRYFLNERENLGLERIDFEKFDYEFRLQTIQRCLKAIGTFSFQSVNRGKTYFARYIEPMFRIVLQSAEDLQKFPALRAVIKQRVL